MRIFGFSITRTSMQAKTVDRYDEILIAATTSLWSWREMFKYLDGDKPENLLGWYLSDSLAREINSRRGAVPSELHMIKIIRPHETHWASVLSCAEKVRDPVIKALLDFGTFRALSDILPHLILRQQDPTRLRWNTADYCKQAGGPDLYTINEAWTSRLSEKT